MAVYEAPTEEECYLWAILSDPSGIDQAEFSWTYPQADDYCFRAWPFQWSWWRNTNPYQIEQLARSLGKSVSAQVRAYAFPFVHADAEMVITAPEGVHLDALTDKIESVLLNNRLSNEMLDKKSGKNGIKHRTFSAKFQNGAHIIGRIPHADGSAVKGCVIEGTLVLAKHGLVKVEELVPGDLVWTHKGRWMPVESIQNFQSDALLVKGVGNPIGITVTDNHRFYGKYSESDDLTWAEPEIGFHWAFDKSMVSNETWAFSDGEYNYGTITSIEKVNKVKIYNPVVKEDHSYVADGTISHNTHPIWLEMDECFPAGTMVLTKSGNKPIEEIEIGEYVLTHNRRWRKVIDTAIRERQTVHVKGHGHPGFVVSENHKFYGIKQDIRYEITDGKLVPKKKTTDGPEWIPAKDLEGNYWSSPTVFPQVKHIPGFKSTGKKTKDPCDRYSEDFFWMMGLYIAEGCYTDGQIYFSIHKNEECDVVNKLHSLGLKTSTYQLNSSPNAINVQVYDRQLGPWLDKHCGHGAHDKEIPPWALGVQKKYRKALLDGLIYGDGYYDPDPRYNSGRWKLTTVSKKLMISARHLALTLGYSATCFWSDTSQRETYIRGRKVNGKGFYQVVGNKNGEGIDHKLLRYTQVKNVEYTGKTEKLYDLTVDEDHSFIAEGICVSNSQNYPDKGWVEIFETLNQSKDGYVWRAHGVTRGIKDYFYQFTQEGSGWHVHRFPAMARPTWTDEERQIKIKQYGSKDDPDYRRNVLGKHGDASSPLFVTSRLLRCADMVESSDYNLHEYQHIKIKTEMLSDYDGDILPFLDFPKSHLQYKATWAGVDIGLTTDPTEILVFAEIEDKKVESYLKLISRITMHRISANDQVRAYLWLMNFYKPKAFCLDRTGIGLPMFQDMQDKASKDPAIKALLPNIKGYNFSEKVLAEFDETIEITPGIAFDKAKEQGIYRNVLEWSTDILRVLVDTQRLKLPYDTELLGEFMGQTYSYDKSISDIYGRTRRFSSGNFHALDAARMAALGWKQRPIEEIATKPKYKPVAEIWV